MAELQQGGNPPPPEEHQKVKKCFFMAISLMGIVKESILKRYLDGWFPMITHNQCKQYDTIVYIDGFAGPGVYGDGREGSPMVALRAVLMHSKINTEGIKIHMFFIEKDRNLYLELEKNLAKVVQEAECLPQFRGRYGRLVTYKVIHSDFNDAIEDIFENNMIQAETPVLSFVDPFGYGCIPMTTMQKLLSCSQNSEIFVNLMVGSVNRRFHPDSNAKTVNALLGQCEAEWKALILNPELDATGRRELFMDLYISKISECRSDAIKTLKFGIRDKRNRFHYYLTYFSRHPKGVLKMKDAMWKHNFDLSGKEFSFSEFSVSKGVDPINYSNKEALYKIVKDKVLEEFNGRVVYGQEIQDYLHDETIYMCNFKIEFRKDFKELIFEPVNNRFLEMVFDFSSVEMDCE